MCNTGNKLVRNAAGWFKQNSDLSIENVLGEMERMVLSTMDRDGRVGAVSTLQKRATNA